MTQERKMQLMERLMEVRYLLAMRVAQWPAAGLEAIIHDLMEIRTLTDSLESGEEVTMLTNVEHVTEYSHPEGQQPSTPQMMEAIRRLSDSQ